MRRCRNSWLSSFPSDDAMAERQLQGAGDVPSSAPGLPNVAIGGLIS